MAVVLLALNGVGLGHLMRTTVVSHALAAIGERRVMFSEGKYHPKSLAPFPVRVIPSAWRSSADFGKQVASELWSMAGMSLPAVLVEDTHPNPIPLRPEIRRVLLVRPTSFDYLIRLNEEHQNIYSAFLLLHRAGLTHLALRRTAKPANWVLEELASDRPRLPDTNRRRHTRDTDSVQDSRGRRTVCLHYGWRWHSRPRQSKAGHHPFPAFSDRSSGRPASRESAYSFAVC